jgi:methyltransferase (TIGR00027 family)
MVTMSSSEPKRGPRGIGKTAVGVALARAEETRRRDRLFNDPYAEAFAADAPDAFGEVREVSPEQAAIGAAFFFHAIIRTRFFDDYLLEATTGPCKQVVLLAVGLDTRAFRLPWPEGVRLFEVDLPDVLAFKERILQRQGAVKGCEERIVVAADLRERWLDDLSAAGFLPEQPTAWLVEGLMTYLSPEEAVHLLGTISQPSVLGSRLAFEDGPGVNSSMLGTARALPDMDEFTTLWKGGLGQEAQPWLESHGWQAEPHDLADRAARYFRSVPAGTGGRFITAVRTQT